MEEKRNQHSLSLMLLEYNKKYTVQYNSGSNISCCSNDYSTVSSSTAGGAVALVVVV